MLCLYGLEGGQIFAPPPLVLSVAKKALGPEGLTLALLRGGVEIILHFFD